MMDEPLKPGDIGEFRAMLDSLESDLEFSSLDQEEKAATIMALRDSYLSERENDKETERIVNEFSEIANRYNRDTRNKATPEILLKHGISYPNIKVDKKTALENIQSFRYDIEEKSPYFDPLVREDYIVQLNFIANQEELNVRGRDVLITTDFSNRVCKGFIGGGMRSVGMAVQAEEFDRTFFHTNQEYNEYWTSGFAENLGDYAFTITAISASTLLGGPYAGVSVAVASSSVKKYQENYYAEMRISDNEYAAYDRALFSVPGAALQGLVISLVTIFVISKIRVRIRTNTSLTRLGAPKGSQSMSLENAREFPQIGWPRGYAFISRAENRRLFSLPFVVISMILTFTSEIVALGYGFYRGEGLWTIVGWAIVAELVLRGVWVVSTMIAIVLQSKE